MKNKGLEVKFYEIGRFSKKCPENLLEFCFHEVNNFSVCLIFFFFPIHSFSCQRVAGHKDIPVIVNGTNSKRVSIKLF